VVLAAETGEPVPAGISTMKFPPSSTGGFSLQLMSSSARGFLSAAVLASSTTASPFLSPVPPFSFLPAAFPRR